MQPRSNFHLGGRAEDAACDLLRAKGFEIIERNYQSIRGTSAGEIDIIAFSEGEMLLVFVEVKQRATHAIAGECITLRQQQRIAMNAQIFIDRNPKYARVNCRYDAILFDASGAALHFENAFGF